MTNEEMLVYVKGSLTIADLSPKIMCIKFDTRDRTLNYSAIVNEELTDYEIEELRCSQTEVFANFPHGQLLRFEIDVYQSDRDGDVEDVPGMLFYSKPNAELTPHLQKYKLIYNEVAEALEPWGEALEDE